MRYSKEFRENLLRQVLSGERSVKELSEKHRVHTGTLYNWLRSKRDGQMTGRKSGMKLRNKHSLLMEAKSKSERELGAWLREKGIHSDRLKRWEVEIASALESAEVSSGEKNLERELKEVRREPARKEKVLAVMTALVVLKKNT